MSDQEHYYSSGSSDTDKCPEHMKERMWKEDNFFSSGSFKVNQRSMLDDFIIEDDFEAMDTWRFKGPVLKGPTAIKFEKMLLKQEWLAKEIPLEWYALSVDPDELTATAPLESK